MQVAIPVVMGAHPDLGAPSRDDLGSAQRVISRPGAIGAGVGKLAL